MFVFAFVCSFWQVPVETTAFLHLDQEVHPETLAKELPTPQGFLLLEAIRDSDRLAIQASAAQIYQCASTVAVTETKEYTSRCLRKYSTDDIVELEGEPEECAGMLRSKLAGASGWVTIRGNCDGLYLRRIVPLTEEEAHAQLDTNAFEADPGEQLESSE